MTHRQARRDDVEMGPARSGAGHIPRIDATRYSRRAFRLPKLRSPGTHAGSNGGSITTVAPARLPASEAFNSSELADQCRGGDSAQEFW